MAGGSSFLLIVSLNSSGSITDTNVSGHSFSLMGGYGANNAMCGSVTMSW
jgi:hypothetical protein